MSLYTLLMAARGRQLLTERGWSEVLDFNAAECGCMLTVAGTVNTSALISLLPCLAARGRLATAPAPDDPDCECPQNHRD